MVRAGQWYPARIRESATQVWRAWGVRRSTRVPRSATATTATEAGWRWLSVGTASGGLCNPPPGQPTHRTAHCLASRACRPARAPPSALQAPAAAGQPRWPSAGMASAGRSSPPPTRPARWRLPFRRWPARRAAPARRSASRLMCTAWCHWPSAGTASGGRSRPPRVHLESPRAQWDHRANWWAWRAPCPARAPRSATTPPRRARGCHWPSAGMAAAGRSSLPRAHR